MANSWELLMDASTLSNSDDTLDSGTFTAKKHLWVTWFTSKGGQIDVSLQFNGVSTGNQYSQRSRKWTSNTPSSGVKYSQNSIQSDLAQNTGRANGIMTINNTVGSPKLLMWELSTTRSPPDKAEVWGKWIPTSLDTQITSIQLINGGSGSFSAPVEIQVWGTDAFSSTPAVNPNLSNGSIFEESDTGKHYMWDGTSAWNEIT